MMPSATANSTPPVMTHGAHRRAGDGRGPVYGGAATIVCIAPPFSTFRVDPSPAIRADGRQEDTPAPVSVESVPRSLHGDRFNHDTEVDGYDADVADESNPIRDGYAATLAAVIAAAAAQPGDTVVDLGTGTGNLALRLPPVARLVCVDISAGMLAAAREAAGRDRVRKADLLEFAERVPAADAIVSTYALHHLTAGGKSPLLGALARALRPGGRLAYRRSHGARRDRGRRAATGSRTPTSTNASQRSSRGRRRRVSPSSNASGWPRSRPSRPCLLVGAARGRSADERRTLRIAGVCAGAW